MLSTLGLVRAMFNWMPESATWVGIVAGPLVLVAYLLGSIPFAYLLSRRRLRRQLDGRTGTSFGVRGPGSVPAALLSAGAALLAATLAWDVALAATPTNRLFSAIGIFSNQAIGAWVSVALWAGLAAVVGNIAPVWTGFRGDTGIAPAAALVSVYAPVVATVAGIAGAVAIALAISSSRAILIVLPLCVGAGYLAWLFDWQGAWGVTNGPELCVWTTVLAATVMARNFRPEPIGQ